MTGHLTDLYLALGQIPGFDAPYLADLQEALGVSGSPTPDAEIREAQAWAARWIESERAGLVFEESAPAWLAPLVEGDADPLPDPRPIPDAEDLVAGDAQAIYNLFLGDRP